MMPNMIKLHETSEGQISHRDKDHISQRCILDSILTQPTNAKPSDLMRNAYNEGPQQIHKMHFDPGSMNLKSIMLEHCYARPYNWRPDANFLRPTKTLFINQENKKKKKRPLEEDVINVEVEPAESPLIYDVAKAKKLMDECDKHISGIRDHPEWDDWEEKIPKANWSNIQHTMFNSIMGVFSGDRMARLAYSGRSNEAILRRTVIDKSVQRFRMVMSKFSWDTKLVQWLHSVLIDYLSAPYLSAYLDILQTLRYKAPPFFDKIMSGQAALNKYGALSPESMNQLLKRVWDPVAFTLSQDKAKKLPGNPIVIIIPSATTMATNVHSKRLNRWINLFGNIATVVTVHNNGVCSRKMTMMNCIDQMFASVRARVQEVKNEFPSKPIVLVGFNSGSALALQVAQVESVLCIVSLGFSMYTPEGNRGDPEDNLLELQAPVLFVIGQHATTVMQENMEDIRERMRVETGLLVVGSADDYLRVTKKVKRNEGITQSIVDRCIVDEVADFVSGLLLSPYPPQIRQSPAYVPPEVGAKRTKVERKRNNSNGSSLDSEPPSPTPRIGRPVGRPPGSKGKSKLEAKWQAIQQGTIHQVPSSSSPSTSNSITPPNPPSTPESAAETADIQLINLNKITQQNDTNTSPNAKLQAMGMYSGTGMSMNKPIQTGVRTIPPNPNKQIKGKLIHTINRPDMHKMAQMSNQNFAGGNMVLMPDGRFKTTPATATIRGNVISPLTKLLTRQYVPSTVPGASSTMAGPSGNPPGIPTARASLTKYITSKKQLQSNRPKQIKKMHQYIPPQTHLPPPTNLTSQDIMDLPIIFADDNQMLTNNTILPSDIQTSTLQQQTTPIKTSTGKFLFLNKPFTTHPIQKANFIKRPAPPAATTTQPPLKYTKIILSKAPEDVKRQAMSKIQELPSMSAPMDIDLEAELLANTIARKYPPESGTPTPTNVGFKTEAGSYKTEALTSTILTNKIKQAIEEMEDDSESMEFDLSTGKNPQPW